MCPNIRCDGKSCNFFFLKTWPQTATFRDCVTVAVAVAGRQTPHGENERYSHTVTVAVRRLYVCTSLRASKCRDLGIHIQYQPAALIKRNKCFIGVSSEPSYTDASTVQFLSRVPSTRYIFRTKALFWTRAHSEQSLPILETASHLQYYNERLRATAKISLNLSACLYISLHTLHMPHFLTHGGNYKQWAQGQPHCSSCTSVSSYISSCVNKNEKEKNHCTINVAK
jgi:hypothetical protein